MIYWKLKKTLLSLSLSLPSLSFYLCCPIKKFAHYRPRRGGIQDPFKDVALSWSRFGALEKAAELYTTMCPDRAHSKRNRTAGLPRNRHLPRDRIIMGRLCETNTPACAHADRWNSRIIENRCGLSYHKAATSEAAIINRDITRQ